MQRRGVVPTESNCRLAVASVFLGLTALIIGRLPEMVSYFSQVYLLQAHALDIPMGALAMGIGLKGADGDVDSTRRKVIAAAGVLLGALAAAFALIAVSVANS